MKYEDFIDTKYKPKGRDVVCEFLVEPNKVNMKHAAGGIAAESSIGTWTELETMKTSIEKLSAKVFQINGNKIEIAYPLDLFELGNMPNLLSSVAGNVFGLKEIRNLRLNDIEFPRRFVKSFDGPKYGISGIRKLTGVKDRPFLGTIIKPKLGLSSIDHSKIAYEAWIGGCDIVKDDENLANQNFNKFRTRVTSTLKSRDKAEKETGEMKLYMANVTAETNEMIKRAKFLEKEGGRYVMVDVLTVGWGALQTLRNEDLDMVLHGHRAMHAAITKNKKHGISMKVLAKLLRIVGVDQLHVGTGIGKMSESVPEVRENISALTQTLYGTKKTMPVASGGIHPLLIPDLISIFGKDVVIQMGGGIHGHPMGTESGSIAARQALLSCKDNIPLKKFAKSHKELDDAIRKWK